MSTSYPIHLNLYGKKVIIIGGGVVAERKIQGLLESGAIIEIISPSLNENLKKIREEYQIKWTKKPFSCEDLDEAFLVIAATNDRKVNQLVEKSSCPNCLVNIADDPDSSDFLIPSVVKRGKLTISISTSGASPILSKKIRQQLEDTYDSTYEEYIDFLHDCRKFVIETIKDPSKKRQLLSAIVDTSLLKSKNRETDFLVLYNNIMLTR